MVLGRSRGQVRLPGPAPAGGKSAAPNRDSRRAIGHPDPMLPTSAITSIRILRSAQTGEVQRLAAAEGATIFLASATYPGRAPKTVPTNNGPTCVPRDEGIK